jgi:ribonuclease HI
VPRVGPASTGEWTIIYTDGACTSNGKKGARAGVGVWFGPNHPYNVSERLPGERQTNQRAELTALKRALNMCPMNRNAHIFSDSHYAIKCVTEWFPNWEKRGWKNSQGKPVENRDIVEEILELIRDRESCKGKTKFEWVKGHSGDAGNEAADSLAVKGITATLPAVTRDQTAEEIAAASLEVDESET